jgi:hypothetical protein
MLFFLTGQGRVLRFVLLPLGIFGCLSVRLRVYSRGLLVELRACFIFSTPSPPFVVLLAGVGPPSVLGNTSHTHAYTITLQPFGNILPGRGEALMRSPSQAELLM